MSVRLVCIRMTAAVAISLAGLSLAACSANDYGATLQAPATFPKLSDVPQRPLNDMPAEEQEALVQELQTLEQTHEAEKIRAIEGQ